MSTAVNARTINPAATDASVLSRILDEGWGPGAWHGADLKAALADVTPELAFWRPSPGRHNIAEIAMHHAYYVRSVRERLAGPSKESFALEGEDWFELSDASDMPWPEIWRVLEGEQQRLAAAVASGAAGPRNRPEPTDKDRFDGALGITCHAIYHAGQVQLIKRLRES